MNDSIILIDKPAGMTSFGVVARLRRVLSARAGKKVKVGHTGTLDPFATGLMIIVTGKACKDAMRYTKLDKVYEAAIILGQTSTTGDPEGEISAVQARLPLKQLHAGRMSPLKHRIVPPKGPPRRLLRKFKQCSRNLPAQSSSARQFLARSKLMVSEPTNLPAAARRSRFPSEPCRFTRLSYCRTIIRNL